MEMNYVDQTAVLGRGCRVGFFTVIGENVRVGEDVHIGNNVTIHPGAIIGNGVRIGDNSVIGKQPRPGKTSTVKYKGQLPPVQVGDGAEICTGAVLYAGTTIGKCSYIGDLASVREECRIGDYVVIGRGTAVENKVDIGNYTKVQTNAYITAYSSLAEHVFIAPCVITTNDNKMGRTEARLAQKKGPRIKKGARLGAGSILLPGITIGEETFAAAGSLVTKDTPPGRLVMGRPARCIRDVPGEELLK